MSLIYLDLCLQYRHKVSTFSQFLVGLFFYHSCSHTNTHAVQIVVDTSLRPASLILRTFVPGLHMNSTLSDDEAI